MLLNDLSFEQEPQSIHPATTQEDFYSNLLLPQPITIAIQPSSDLENVFLPEPLVSGERGMVIKTLRSFMRRIQKSESPAKLRQIRLAALEYVKQLRDQHRWDAEEDGIMLQEIIRISQKKERDLARSASGKILEAPELTKMLRDDPFQHTCDVRDCCKMSIGWLCVFCFCHIPWIISLVLVGVNYRVDEINGMGGFPSGRAQNACLNLSRYMLGFFVIYCVNVIVGLIFAVAKSIDQGKNKCVRASPVVMAFISTCLVLYNIYGIIVVWTDTLWSSSLPSDCVQLRDLTVALVAFFFLLPICCFASFQLLGSRESSPLKNGLESFSTRGK